MGQNQRSGVVKLEAISTGGGCKAYFAKLPNGWHLAITDSGDPSLPDARSTHVSVGIYREEDWSEKSQVAFEVVKITSTLARQDPGHMKHVCEVIAWQVASKHCELEDEDPYAKEHLGPSQDEGIVDTWIVAFRFKAPLKIKGEALQRWARDQVVFLASQDLSPLPEGTDVEVASIEWRPS